MRDLVLLNFRKAHQSLMKEKDELRESFHIARNMACTEWTEGFDGMEPNKVLPHQTTLLKTNFDMLEDELSLRRFFLIATYYQLLKGKHAFTHEDVLCYNHWRPRTELPEALKDLPEKIV